MNCIRFNTGSFIFNRDFNPTDHQMEEGQQRLGHVSGLPRPLSTQGSRMS